ncbi:MAG: hypothetical protein HFG09_09460 [Oscillibacter sp.]|nr:hypothetical protein [Oscillibacter sp.]
MENKAAKQYLARVKRALVCDKTDRCRLLERCAAMIDSFQQESPEAGYDGLVAAFGEPDAFVAELLSGLDEAAVKTARKRQRLIRWGAVAVIIAVLIAISFFWYIKFIRTRDLDENMVVVQGPATPLTEEEFRELWENLPGASTAYGEGYEDGYVTKEDNKR